MDKCVLEVGKRGGSEMIANYEEEERAGSRPRAVSKITGVGQYYLLGVLDKELQVDLEHSLEQAHIRTLVQADLMLPDIDDQDLARRQSEQGALALKVLVLAALATVGTLNIHDQNVFRHAPGTIHALVLAHPYALGGLTALLLGHDTKLGAKEVVEERGFSRGLRAEDGYEVVIEARGDDLLDVEVRGEVLAAMTPLLAIQACKDGHKQTYLKSLSSSMT